MPFPDWLLWYLPAIFLFNLLVVWLVIRRSSPDTSDDDTPGGGRIQCPDCQTENDARFQFCRSCLEELPKGRIGQAV